MKVLIQRVQEATVLINSQIHSKIDHGLLLYLCLESNDSVVEVEKAVKKIVALRIFEDSQGKMNESLNISKKEVLLVSQFTLSWSGEKGNRPSFEGSMKPDKAKLLYHTFIDKLSSEVDSEVKTGQFGADMKIHSVNDGPVTFFLNF